MIGVHPYIAFPGTCRQAIDFYRSVLNAEVLFTQTVGESPMSDMGPADNIMHCTIKVGDSMIMLCDNPGGGQPSTGGPISLTIGLNDPGRACAIFDALAQGGS